MPCPTFEENIVRMCAPTLANRKTGSLFSQPFCDRKRFLNEVNRLNRLFLPKGLRVLPLKLEENRALVYVYRPSSLKKDLSREDVRQVLLRQGYENCSPVHCLANLRCRLRDNREFPHEIGLFLSYPPEDVEGFMHSSCNYKCCGAWKVYGDLEKARETFRIYRHCEKCYVKCYRRGFSLERLAVAG